MSESKQATVLLRTDSRTRSDDERSVGVDQVLQMTGQGDEIEVYVGWRGQAVNVAFRRYGTGIQDWAVVGPLLQERAMLALRPLLTTGWQLAGSFAGSARWDMSKESGGDSYEGCWVKLRRSM